MARVSVKSGPAWMTMTPIGRPVEWLREHIEGDPARGIAPREDWEQHRIRLTVEDCPHRTQESIDIQLAGCSTWEIPQRRDGEWEGIEVDRRIDGFSPDNVAEPAAGYRYMVRLSLDHGESAGKEFVLLGYVNRETRSLHVVDEYVSPTTTTPEDDHKGIGVMLARHGLKDADLDEIVGDVNSAGKQAAGLKVNDLFRALFNKRVDRPDKGAGSVDYGVRILNYAFKADMITVSERCVKLNKCLKNWTGADDKLKDGIDSLRYLAVPVIESFMEATVLDRLRIY